MIRALSILLLIAGVANAQTNVMGVSQTLKRAEPLEQLPASAFSHVAGNPLAWFGFGTADTDATAYDLGPLGNNAAQAVASNQAAVASGVRYFDRDDYMSLGDDADFETSDFSIFAWIKRECTNSEYHAVGCIQNNITPDGGASPCGAFFRVNADNGLTFAIYSNNTAVSLVTGAGLITSNVWKSVCTTKAGQDMTIYVDGAAVTSRTILGTVDWTATPGTKRTLLGAYWYSNVGGNYPAVHMLRGWMDDAVILKEGITAAQVLRLHNATSGKARP